jgi:two-component sensor histidine kinase
VEAALLDVLGGKRPGKIDYRVLGDDQIVRCIESMWTVENGPDGKPVEAFATNLDITGRKRAEEHSELLVGEVNHRAKNLLAVVQAVIRQTGKHTDPATFVMRVTERIDALTMGHDLLVKNHGRGVGVSDLVEAQLAHLKELIGARVLLDGPPGRLTPAAAQGIGMALHELATNASKYGALSNSEGQIRISWQVAATQDRTFTMQWLEDGGPKVVAPTHKGFGQMVIARMAELAVNGAVEVEYRESGLCWRLTAPASEALEGGRVASSDKDDGR